MTLIKHYTKTFDHDNVEEIDYLIKIWHNKELHMFEAALTRCNCPVMLSLHIIQLLILQEGWEQTDENIISMKAWQHPIFHQSTVFLLWLCDPFLLREWSQLFTFTYATSLFEQWFMEICQRSDTFFYNRKIKLSSKDLFHFILSALLPVRHSRLILLSWGEHPSVLPLLLKQLFM